MRARIRSHALSNHAAAAALTAMERGRLEHIARSIPPEHSTASEPRAKTMGPRPRIGRWMSVDRWLQVTAVASLIGVAVVLGLSTLLWQIGQ